jgi:hypothetical protein
MMEAMHSSETSLLTRATRCHISEDGILHSRDHENLKSFEDDAVLVTVVGFLKFPVAILSSRCPYCFPLDSTCSSTIMKEAAGCKVVWCHDVEECSVVHTSAVPAVGDVRILVIFQVTFKNGVYWDVTQRGSCKSQRFGGTVFICSMLRFLVTPNVVPSSPILVTLMMEALSSSETSGSYMSHTA